MKNSSELIKTRDEKTIIIIIFKVIICHAAIPNEDNVLFLKFMQPKSRSMLIKRCFSDDFHKKSNQL